MNESTFDAVRMAGHFHPMLVHLPIGFLVLAGAFELLARWERYRSLTAANRVVLALSVPASIAAAGCGWLLAEGGGYDAALLGWHRWTGVAVAVVVPVCWWFCLRGWLAAYRVALVLALGLVGLAGHHGGSLTHGRDFLFRHAPGTIRRWLDPAGLPAGRPTTGTVPTGAEAPVFEAVIQPVLEQYCVSCHGPEKAKGKLRVDSIEGLTQGGEGGAAIRSGSGAESLLVRRMNLPEDDDERMPPSGKPQPSAEAIRLVTWWIDAGAVPGKSARELGAPAAVLEAMAKVASGGNGGGAAGTPTP